MRTAFHHWLLIYQNARRAWDEIVDRHATPCPTSSGRRPGSAQAERRADATRRWRRSSASSASRSTRPPETAFGLVISGKASMDAVRELVKDFIHLDATRNIAGPAHAPRRRRARVPRRRAGVRDGVGRLPHAQPHGDLGRLLRAGARHHARGALPLGAADGDDRVALRDVVVPVHGAPEEAIAAFHLGPPTTREGADGQARARPRPGRRRRRGTDRLPR